jgi:hypothetical protein
MVIRIPRIIFYLFSTTSWFLPTIHPVNEVASSEIFTSTPNLSPRHEMAWGCRKILQTVQEWTTVLKFSKFLATFDLVELNVLSFQGLLFFERMLRGEVTCKRNENRSVYRLNLPIFGWVFWKICEFSYQQHYRYITGIMVELIDIFGHWAREPTRRGPSARTCHLRPLYYVSVAW